MCKSTETMMKVFLALAASCTILLAPVVSIEPAQCEAQLGMEDETIHDDDITASSSFDQSNVGPQHGRIRNEKNGGAWCPQTQATSESKEWIQIDLKSVYMITKTESQGRFGNGQGVEYAEAYALEYWRPRLNKWIRYRNRQNSELIEGNFNTYTTSKQVLDPPIWASKLRFLPHSIQRRTVCMRVEAYGCKWTDGIVSYSMPQGDKRGTSWEFYDTSYDGHWDGEKLKYGLGQLTDGHVAPDDFKDSFYTDSSQGWVGWRNDTRDNKPIEITFEFDKVREFSAVHIFANNQFVRDVQVFAEAKVFFSVSGKRYKGKPITFDTMEDRIFESPRNVTIKLHHRVGRFVKLQLHFAARWMLLSEITFDSIVVNGNFTEEEEQHEEVVLKKDQIPTPGIENRNAVTAVNSSPGLGQYLGVIVGILSVLVVLMIAVVLYVVIQQKRYKSSPRPSQVPGGCDKAALYREPSLGRLPLAGSACGSEYSESAEYAVPLQPALTPRGIYGPGQKFASAPPIPPPPETYYAARDVVCGGVFVPPPPPLSTPPPVRLTRQPRYVSANSTARTYIGP